GGPARPRPDAEHGQREERPSSTSRTRSASSTSSTTRTGRSTKSSITSAGSFFALGDDGKVYRSAFDTGGRIDRDGRDAPMKAAGSGGREREDQSAEIVQWRGRAGALRTDVPSTRPL